MNDLKAEMQDRLGWQQRLSSQFDIAGRGQLSGFAIWSEEQEKRQIEYGKRLEEERLKRLSESSIVQQLRGKEPKMLKLYTVAAVWRPSDEDKDAEVCLHPVHLMAKDENHARLLAAREIGDAWKDKLKDIEVLVRPF